MVSEKGCLQNRGGKLSTDEGQKEEIGWHVKPTQEKRRCWFLPKKNSRKVRKGLIKRELMLRGFFKQFEKPYI